REPLAHVADSPLHILRPIHDVQARYRCLSLTRRQQAAQPPARSRLPRSIGPETAEYLSPAHAEGDVLHCGETSEAPREVSYLDGVHVTASAGVLVTTAADAHVTAPVGEPMSAMKVSSIPGSTGDISAPGNPFSSV